MALILDTDVIVRGEKGTFDLTNWLAARSGESVGIAAVTVAELWHGVERAQGSHRLKREKYLQVIVSALPIIPYTEATAYEHARIWAKLEAAGKMIGYYDLIIAATAMEHRIQVATFNKRHFGLVSGLNIIEPQ